MNIKCFLPSRELSLKERMSLGVKGDDPIILVGTKHVGNVSEKSHAEILQLLGNAKGKPL